MPSNVIISFVLWIPFAIIVVISGLIFCTSGYKKGLWRALLALAATIVAALLSLLLAKLISGAVAPSVLTLVPAELPGMDGLPVGLLTELVTGVVKMVISLVLFPIFMFILTLVLRLVCDHFLKEKLSVSGKGMQWGGMAVGLVAAVCYTLLMLLPLYGTCSAYIPTLESLMSLQGDKEAEDEMTEMLRAVSEHPVVKMSGSAPAAALYSGLASLDVGDASLDIPKMSATIEKVLDSVQKLSEADAEDVPQLAKEMVDLLRREVVETDWFYSMATDFIKEVKSMVPQEEGYEEEMAFINAAFDILDCPKEDFKANCAAILDFFGYVLEQDLEALAETEDATALYDTGIIAEAGKLANVSDEAIRVKEMLLAMSLLELFDNEIQDAYGFVKGFDLHVTDPQVQEQDAEGILSLMDSGYGSLAEAILRLPYFGEDVLNQLIEKKGLGAVLGFHSEYEQDSIAIIDGDPALQQQLIAKLKECAAAPLWSENESFHDYLQQQDQLFPQPDFEGDFSFVIGGEDYAQLPEGFYYDENGNLYFEGELVGSASDGSGFGGSFIYGDDVDISYGNGMGNAVVIVRP